MARIVAINCQFSKSTFITESPANPLRHLESTPELRQAKMDFIDQADINAYAVARSGVATDWIALDLTALGMK
jgi:hypothetical protein